MAALRRSLLYVPASSPRMLAKSLTLASDNITYDLEDAVTETAKPAARAALQAHLAVLTAKSPSAVHHHHRPEIAVRINAVSTRHALADLLALGPRGLAAVDALVVPKVQSAADLSFVADVVRQTQTEETTKTEKKPKLIALVESARAIMDLGAICAAGVPLGLDGLIFAAEDFALDLGLTRTRSLAEMAYARSAVVTAARAYGLASALDLVCTAFRGDDGLATLAAESRAGRSMGFTGKQCIHPTQVAVVQQVFGRLYDDADRSELAWAVRVLAAEAKSAASGRGAFTLDGAMIDAPVVGKAQRLVELAERAGAGDFLKQLRREHRHQEPE